MLYTGKGDDGKTKLFGSGERLQKNCPNVEALGTVDELNSLLGLCRARAREKRFPHEAALLSVQEDLFIIQAQLAGAPKEITADAVKYLEKEIAAIEKEIPPITSFVVPGETELSALLHVARAVARRAERRVVAAEKAQTNPALLAYLNRVSSLLYALARLASHTEGTTERSPRY